MKPNWVQYDSFKSLIQKSFSLSSEAALPNLVAGISFFSLKQRRMSPTAVRDAVAQLTQRSDPLAVKSAFQMLIDLCRSDQTNATRMTVAGVVEAAARVVDTSNDASAVQAAFLLLEHMSGPRSLRAHRTAHPHAPFTVSTSRDEPGSKRRRPSGNGHHSRARGSRPASCRRDARRRHYARP
jgi:hypothetical protein